jgi:hypothetical protein
MKKLVLGLIAVVMFGNLSFGNECVSRSFFQNDFLIKYIGQNNDALIFGCQNFSQDIYIDGQYLQTVDLRVCCHWYTSGGTPSINCWVTANKGLFNAYISVANLSNDLQVVIKNRKTDKFKVLKGNKISNDGLNYELIEGDYLIEKDPKGIEFVKVNILKS